MELNETDNQGLDAKQVKILQALLSEPTLAGAARAARISQTTIWRAMNEPAFAAAYKQAREGLLEATLRALQAATIDAVAALREVVTDREAQHAARVGAARVILEYALKIRETIDIEPRLADLEKRLDGVWQMRA